MSESDNRSTIKISDIVVDKLKMIKKRNGHTSMDSVLRSVLEKVGESINSVSVQQHLNYLVKKGILKRKVWNNITHYEMVEEKGK